MVDTSWILGIVMTACFSIGVVAILVKLLGYMFSKDKEEDKKENEE